MKIIADKRILCLIRLADDVKLSKYGYPHGKGTVGMKTGTLYVFDASNIVCSVGVIQSSIHKGRYYYVYENMMNESLELGLHLYN